MEAPMPREIAFDCSDETWIKLHGGRSCAEQKTLVYRSGCRSSQRVDCVGIVVAERLPPQRAVALPIG